MEPIAIVSSAAALVLAILEAVRRIAPKLQEIQRELRANTTETVAAKDAAKEAADQVNWRQRYTAASLELDEARRKLSLVQALPGCFQCRMEIEKIIAAAPINRRSLDRVSDE